MLNSATKCMSTNLFGWIFGRHKKIKNTKYVFEIFINETLFTYYIVTNCPGK